MFVSDQINKLVDLLEGNYADDAQVRNEHYRLYSLPKRPGSHVRILVQTWLQIRTPTIQFTSIQKKVEKLSTKNCGIINLYTLSNIE